MRTYTHKMTIDRKLIAGAVLMTLTGLGACASGWYAVQTLAAELIRATGRSAQKLALAGQLKAAVNIADGAERNPA